MKEALDKQKRYVENRIRPLEFMVGDKVFLKVASWKCIIQFGMKGKLTPKCIGPFKVIEIIGLIAYRLMFPP